MVAVVADPGSEDSTVKPKLFVSDFYEFDNRCGFRFRLHQVKLILLSSLTTPLADSTSPTVVAAGS